MKIILFLFVSTLIFITSPSLGAESQTFQNMGEYEFYINEEYQTVRFVMENDVLSAVFKYGRSYHLQPREDKAGSFINRDETPPYEFIFSDGIPTIIRAGICYTGKRSCIQKPPIMLSRDEMRSDLEQLQKILKTHHPALFDFITEPKFNAIFNNVREKIQIQECDLHFFKQIAPIVSAVACGHSIALLPISFFRDSERTLPPITIDIVEGKVFIRSLIGDTNRKWTKAQLLAIDDRPIQDILEEIFPLVSSDGDRPGYKISRIKQDFSIYHSALFGNSASYRLKLKKNLEPPTQITVKGIGFKIYRQAQSQEPPLTLQFFADHSIACLRIATFNNDLNEFKTNLDTLFASIARHGVNSLIIDLRDNHGGDPYCAAHLLSYLLPRPISYFHLAYPGYESLAQPVLLHTHSFRGQLILLIDGGCFSTTGHLLALLKDQGVGLMIGQETTGSFICHDDKRYFELRHSRIQVQLARKSYAVKIEHGNNRHGILPDIERSQRIEDYLMEQDTALQEAVLKIKRGQSL